MEQTRALNALEPFLALSKSATAPRAAADLIIQATSASNTYVFAELLATPHIQALKENDEFANHYRLLEIFAWGTWEEYQGDYFIVIVLLRISYCFSNIYRQPSY